MLILSRKRNEQIVIGDGIVITVVAIRGGNVRLGVEAPSHVAVHRQEVYKAICDAKSGVQVAQEPSLSEGESSDTPA